MLRVGSVHVLLLGCVWPKSTIFAVVQHGFPILHDWQGIFPVNGKQGDPASSITRNGYGGTSLVGTALLWIIIITTVQNGQVSP